MILVATEAEKKAMEEMGISIHMDRDEVIAILIREIIALKTPKKESYDPATGQTYGNSELPRVDEKLFQLMKEVFWILSKCESDTV